MVGRNGLVGWSTDQKWALREMIRRQAPLCYYPGGSWVPAGVPVGRSFGLSCRPARAVTRLEMLALERAGLLERTYETTDDHFDTRQLSTVGWKWAWELLSKKDQARISQYPPPKGVWIAFHTRRPEPMTASRTSKENYTSYRGVKQ